MRLKAKYIGDDMTLDEYNAYQYLLYHMDCWEETIHLDMEENYVGEYSRYMLDQSPFLLNDKHDTYKVRTDLDSSSKLRIFLEDISRLFDKHHMEFSCVLYYKPNKAIDDKIYEPTDYEDIDQYNQNKSQETPDPEKEYQKITIPCILDDTIIEIPLWDNVNNKPLLEKNTLIYRWLKLKIDLSKTPYIDIKNGKATEPYEILIDSLEELIKLIKRAPRDGTLTVVRLDSTITYNVPKPLIIEDGQNIEIRGGTAGYITSTGFKGGRAVLNGRYCKRTFIVKPGGMLKLDHLTLVNNNSIGYNVYDRGRGGAVLVESIRKDNGEPKFGILKCEYCSFQNNKAVSGGAIFSYHAGVFLDTCDFINNSSTNNGGAVYFLGNDVKLHFANMTVANGTAVQLKVKITDYLARLVDEGYVDFYLKSGSEDVYLGTVDVAKYNKVSDTYKLTTIPNTGTIKDTITEDDEIMYEIIVKNHFPVTQTTNGVTRLKALYDNNFNQITLAEGESRFKAVFKKEVDGVPITTKTNEETKKKYLDYTNPNLLKYIVYLDELTGYSYTPYNAVIKKDRTDTANEITYPVILKYDKPVTVTVNNVTYLKPPYDSENFKPIDLDEGEILDSIVFKKKKDGEAIPTVYNQDDGKTYLDYGNHDVLEYIVYNQSIDLTNINKGWAVYEYNIPRSNTKPILNFIAVYNGGAMYDSDAVMNTVSVVFPETYTADYVSKNNGALGSTITITVKVTGNNQTVITKPKGTFTIDGNKYTAMNNSENYYIKYKIPESLDDDTNTIPISFELEKSINYVCSPADSEITIGTKEKYLINGAINGVFVDELDIQKTSPTSSTYTDDGITSSLVESWINAGLTDVFVRCRDYSNAQKKATLITALDRLKGKKLRVHAVIDCFYNHDGTSVTEKWTNVNPSTLSRKTWITNQITSILNYTAVDGICLDYCRFEGGSELSSNGNIETDKRKQYVTDAVKEIVEKIVSISPKTYISLTVMPEEKTDTNYGQSFKELGDLVDYIIPLAYKGDYSAVSNNSDSWLVDVCNLVAKEVDKSHILCCLQTYTNNTELEKAIADNKLATVCRAKSNLDSSINALATAGIKGVCLYREGLIQNYPKQYKI